MGHIRKIFVYLEYTEKIFTYSLWEFVEGFTWFDQENCTLKVLNLNGTYFQEMYLDVRSFPIAKWICSRKRLFYGALKHQQLCANSFLPSDLILNFLHLVEMLCSPRGTKPLEGFLFGSKLNE